MSYPRSGCFQESGDRSRWNIDHGPPLDGTPGGREFTNQTFHQHPTLQGHLLRLETVSISEKWKSCGNDHNWSCGTNYDILLGRKNTCQFRTILYTTPNSYPCIRTHQDLQSDSGEEKTQQNMTRADTWRMYFKPSWRCRRNNFVKYMRN